MLLRLRVQADVSPAVEQSANRMMMLLLKIMDKQLEQGLQVGRAAVFSPWLLCSRPAAGCLLKRS